MNRLLLSWSSGKDCAWALKVLRDEGEFAIAGLVTTFNGAFDRVAMHAVRRQLAEAQAAAAGLNLWSVDLPWPCPNAEYERLMGGLVARARALRPVKARVTVVPSRWVRACRCTGASTASGHPRKAVPKATALAPPSSSARAS